MKDFRAQRFFHCYDCGWGEKGVHSANLSFDQAYALISSRSSEETAQRWARDEDEFFEFTMLSDVMVSEQAFDQDDWEGRQDY